LLLSSLNVLLQDIERFMRMIHRLIFYSTPILYPLSMLEESDALPRAVKVIYLANPLVGVLDRLRRWHLIGARRHRRWHFAARREMLRLSRGLAGYLAGPRRDIALSIVFTFVFLLSLFSFPALLMWALDYNVDYLTVVGLLTVTTFIMYFSPTPGASGIAEGVFGYFFAGLVSAGHLVLITVAWRLLTIYLGMAVGLAVVQRELLRDQ
jgi:uncharacterized protein (TIRG00374 family)